MFESILSQILYCFHKNKLIGTKTQKGARVNAGLHFESRFSFHSLHGFQSSRGLFQFFQLIPISNEVKETILKAEEFLERIFNLESMHGLFKI